MSHARTVWPQVGIVTICVLVFVEAVAAETVWTGHTFTFEKAPFADETLPENQDCLVSAVCITRASTQGIFNIAEDDFYTTGSPSGTEWAFPHNNPAATLAATNWQDLTFADWLTALGGSGAGGPPSTVGQNAVLHLIDDDIYLDIRFTAWGMGFSGGGSFAYERGEPPSNVATGDYNGDGKVGPGDYTLWRNSLGYTGVDPAADGTGDDLSGIPDGDVDRFDYDFWKLHYGEMPGSGASLANGAAHVPEPASGALMLLGIAALLCSRGRRV